ncbi:MAG: type II secretion system F family protein [Defluviitaleaceae bacterium]|nr:type II secretion system F family protein [Defluviitaleaceae bacterium]
MKFKYIVATKENSIMKGSVFASTQAEATVALKEMGYHVISVKTQNIFTKVLFTKIVFSKSQVLSSQDIAFFCRHMYFFINAGVSLTNLNLTTAPNKVLAKELENIRTRLINGENISAAVEACSFPPLLCNMIKIGEETGKLGDILLKMEKHYEKQAASQQEIANILFYPIITFIAMVFVIGITMTYLVPNFIQMFAAQNMDLPSATTGLIAVSNFFVNGRVFLLLIPVLLTIILAKFRKFDKMVFHIPFIKKYFTLVSAARFSSALAVMLETGVVMVKAIGACEGLLKNQHYKNIIQNMRKDVEEGERLGTALRYNFPPLLKSMVELGENTGKLPETLEKCSLFFEKEQNIAFTRLKRLIEPVLTIVMGLILLFIMLAIMLPTFELTGML